MNNEQKCICCDKPEMAIFCNCGCIECWTRLADCFNNSELKEKAGKAVEYYTTLPGVEIVGEPYNPFK